MANFVQLHRYIAIVRRWWWLMLLLPVVAGITGYAVSQRQAPVYAATTTLLVGQSIQTGELTLNDIETSGQLAMTYADIARRQPILQSVVDRLKLKDTWRQLKNRVKVASVGGTQLFQITVEASSPEEAQVTADEIAHQLILMSPTAEENLERDENQRFVRQQIVDLQARIEEGQATRDSLEADLAKSLSAKEVQELWTEINSIKSLLADWQGEYTQLLIFVESRKSPNSLTVVEPAQAGSEPVQPRTSLNTIVAGATGLGLALGLILLLEYLDDTLKLPDDLSQSLGLATLGTVSRIKGKGYPEKSIADQDPFSPVSEAYRMIRTNIQFMTMDRPAKSIMVTSAVSGEGKSITAANLGIVMAQAGLKTVIVDADLRWPVQHLIFKVPHTRGLTDLLRSSQFDITSHLKPTGIENLQLLTCGALPPDPSELLGSERMGQLLAILNERVDVAIFDTPPLLAVADAAILSRRADGVVLVIEAGQTRREIARQAIANLTQSRANLLGGVLNRVHYTQGGDYYHHHYASKKPGLASQPAHSGQ